MKFDKLLTILLACAVLLSSLSITGFAQTETTENLSEAGTEQIFKKYLDGNGATGERFIFTSFGAYKDYQVCYGGYELTQPWEPWARIGNYAFRLNVHMNGDKTLLGLYLVKADEVLRLEDAYGNTEINNEDMTEIVKLITANGDYEKYFYLYDVVDVTVGFAGDYTVRYEGVTNPYSTAGQSIETSRRNMKIGNYNLTVFGSNEFVSGENTTLASDKAKGLYVVDKDNKVIDFAEALEKSLIGTAEDVVKLLNDSEFSSKGYWNVGKTDATEPVTTQPVTTEPTTEAPTTTEPTTEPSTTEPSTTEPATECNHSQAKTTTTAATYFAKGKTVVTCAACGKVVKTTSIAKKVLKTPTVTVKAAKKSIKITYKKAVKGAKGFVVKYQIKGKKKVYTKTFKANKKVTKVIKKLKSGKKYKVSVRAYIKSGKKIAYSKWTNAKTIKVK